MTDNNQLKQNLDDLDIQWNRVTLLVTLLRDMKNLINQVHGSQSVNENLRVVNTSINTLVKHLIRLAASISLDRLKTRDLIKKEVEEQNRTDALIESLRYKEDTQDEKEAL